MRRLLVEMAAKEWKLNIMSDTYFVVHCSEDGVSIRKLDKKKLLGMIAENYWGKIKTFITDFERLDIDMMREDELAIIRGEVVKPIEKVVVKEYDLR